MNPLHLFFLRLWALLISLPPISIGRLLMPAVLIVSWSALRSTSLPVEVSFVWAIVLAQSVQIWAVLPVTVRRQRLVFGEKVGPVGWAIAFIFFILVVQIWLADPVISHRIVSIYCGLYALIMVAGIWGDQDVLNRFAPAAEDRDATLSFRRHLLKLYAIVCILIIVVNETLLGSGVDFSARVAAFAMLPIVLHYFFAATLLLTFPQSDEDGS